MILRDLGPYGCKLPEPRLRLEKEGSWFGVKGLGLYTDNSTPQEGKSNGHEKENDMEPGVT